MEIMILDGLLLKFIVACIFVCIGGIFAYLRKKFKCQDSMQAQLNILDSKVDALIQIEIIFLEKTHPNEVDEFKKLINLATKK